VRTWFERRFGSPSRAQELGWPVIAESQRSPGHDVLLCAPTGSGKTLAAFMWAINRLVLEAENDALIDEVSVLYVSPLKALANDIRLNLEEPLSGVKAVASEFGLKLAAIRAGLRTGDTPAGERTAMLKRPPHILVTTPESLFILLTSPRFREKLRAVRYIIVDELHAVAGNKRGAHLMVTLERLERMVRQGGAPRPARIGLSATLNPIETLAAFLAGAEVDSGGERHPRPVRIVRADDSVRSLDLKIIAPGPELGSLATHQHWEAMYDALASLIREHRTTLIFTLSRRWAERIALALQKRVGVDAVMAHHGSLARAERLMAEQRLKRGELKAIVATASLELGIDVGAVDLVCQVDSPKSISAAIQRIGRSGHQLGGTPKGRFFALTVDDLLECASAVRAIKRGHLDEVEVPSGCLDVAAQQIVAIAAEEDEIGDAELLRLLRRTHNFATLDVTNLQRLLEEMATQLPERIQGAAPKIFYDRAGARVRARRGARLAAITSGGTIPESGNYDVVIASEGRKIGDVEEDFAQESMRGDIFSLGSMPWRILGISKNRLMVEGAPGMAPSLPFWQTEAAGRSPALSAEVCDVRRRVAAFLAEPGRGNGAGEAAAVRWLVEECALEENAAKQAVDYVRAGVAALGAVPDEQTLVVERFFDGLGGTQIVIHSPRGIRVNRGLGLALRKRLCQSFDFEIQASAIDDAVLLALNSRHSFSLEYVLTMLNARTVREVLIQALLDAPMFEVRFRHVATRALSVIRSNRGRKVPAWIQRLRSQELITALFPQRNACLDNRPVTIDVPEHFIVRESVRECLEESTDLPRLVKLLEGLEDGSVRAVMADNVAPSAFAHRVLLAWDYSFLDDGERANRRSRTVTMNRAMAEDVLREEDLAEMLSGEAIATVVAEASGYAPVSRARNRDELYEILRAHGALPADALAERAVGDAHEIIAALEAAGRVLRTRVVPEAPQMMIAAEDAAIFAAAYPRASFEQGEAGSARARDAAAADGGSEVPTAASASAAPGAADADAAREELVRRALATSGPTTANDLTTRLWMAVADVEGKLASLEAKGSVFRGHFTTRRSDDVANAHGARANEQWCDRYVLERIHRQTLNRLRSEIEPCSDSEFAAFRLQWQHVGDSSLPPDRDGVGAVIEQLRGLAFTPEFWERSILAGRIHGYRPEHLDLLCMSGDIVWVAVPVEEATRADELPTQVAFLPRRYPLVRLGEAREITDPKERAVYAVLGERGAQYLDQVAERSGLSERDALGALWRLAAAGMVSNDSFAPLRLFWSDPDAARVVASGSEHRGFSRHDAALRARLKSSLSGRWSQIESMANSARDGNGAHAAQNGDDHERRQRSRGLLDGEKEFAKLLLARNGILSREMLALESVSVSWNEIVFALRRMEYAGTIRRGYFVRSLSGEQYALPEAVEKLRAMRALNPSAEPPIALSAADPANPYGVLIPGCGITRDPANLVVIRAGRVILGLAGRTLVTPAQLDDDEFGEALDALMALRPRLVIDTIDGCPALESGRVHVMAARGFHSDGRALVYDGLPGPRPSRVAAVDAQRAHPQARSET